MVANQRGSGTTQKYVLRGLLVPFPWHGAPALSTFGTLFLVSAQQSVPPRTRGFGHEMKLPAKIHGICPFPFAVRFPNTWAMSGDEQKASSANGYKGRQNYPKTATPRVIRTPKSSRASKLPRNTQPQLACALSTYDRSESTRWHFSCLTHTSSAIYAETAAQGLLLFFTPTVATGYQRSQSAG